MAAVFETGRRQVLAHRVAAHQLDRSEAQPGRLAVLDLGVQDTPHGSARLALAARSTAEPPDDGSLTLIWSTRGAPHLHRRGDLPALAAALWPLSDADATARISATAIREGARMGTAAFTAAAEAMRAVVREPMPKGEVSAAVSARVPQSLTYWCRVCQAQHISGGLFQQVGLPAGVRLDPSGPGTVLAPVQDWPGVPGQASGTADLLRTQLRLLGPAGLPEAAKFLGTTQTATRQVWPGGLAEVRVDGRTAWLPEEDLEALRSAPAPRLVRLLPPSDPYLQARDRGLLVPDRERQQAVWRVLSGPGALLVDGEITGVWRSRLASKGRLDVTVTAFEPLSSAVRGAVQDEAQRVAGVRGAADLTLTFSG
ncbi:DNA glycosylase AlkZ-like family protein [Streptacidiphilus griseoplanus]|uniref:DNA glycosylase AlkZ-like family protein n=1 Tax=Peterkaempfera griseoplana TaxID=66896 RepID=UPI0006E2A8FC|nr:crosslink repair DNA glycosylase YcaQ family protein [Peterkaempfera griseoplana]